MSAPPPLLPRRAWVLAALLSAGLPLGALAQRRPDAGGGAPRCGTDPALIASGVTGRWTAAMKRDLGWSAQWLSLSSEDTLRQLERGEIDLGLFLTHPLADTLERDGFIHERVSLARTDVLMVGPLDDAAGIRQEPDARRALQQVRAGVAAGALAWTPPPAGSALAALAQRLMGGVPRAAPTAAARPGYALWLATDWRRQPASATRDRRVWLQGGPELVLDVQLARSFRVRHPGGKLLSGWLQGPIARRAFTPASGWTAVKA